MLVRINAKLNSSQSRLGGSAALAYCAGLTDGEGCIHIARQKHPGARSGYVFRLVVTIAQNHLGTVLDFQELIGVEGLVYKRPRRGSQNRDDYQLVYHGRKAEEILLLLQPYLNRKKMEADVALDFQQNCELKRHFGPNGCPDHIWKKREACYRKLKSLK